MRRIMRLLTIAGAIGGAIWLSNARRRAQVSGRPLGDLLWADMRGFMTRRIDPLVMRLGMAGGQRSACGVIEHAGRVSGTLYRTPVLPRLADDEVFIPLPYGTNVNWIRNVRAAGHCRLQVHDTILELDEPVVVPAAENPAIPEVARGPLDRIGAHYLRLHVLDRAPGAFSHLPPEAMVSASEHREPEIELVHPPAPAEDSVVREAVTV
jgi:hypothetical protein